MKPRIIVCGLGLTGYKIFCLLRQQGASVIGIHAESIPGEDYDVVIGELRAASTLKAAGIQEAHTLVLAGEDEALNLAILTQARILNPRIRIINRLFNTSLGDRLNQTLADHVTMSVAALAAPVFAFAALGSQAIGQLRLFNQTWPIHEEYINEMHPWIGRKLSDLWDDRSRMLIYYLPVDGEMDLISAVVYGQPLQAGDRLIVGTQPSVRTSGKPVLPKLFKVLTNFQQFPQYGQPIAVVTLVLLITVFVATLTYVCVDAKISVVDSLYFSVGMITGAGGNEKVAEHAPDSIKIFTAMMMLLGAGVIGICYALLNDFVLGTRFKQFWDAARVPGRNHYIVCGLGGIGVQIVNQLHTHGHEVVVIERDANNRFLNTVRALKVPVIQGDASLSTTLKAANVDKADALLAVTSDDMANLEIALSAKGIAPKLAVVVRNQDPHFASQAQKVFEFDAVLSPTELAAPSFAAAALGGRILGNGITGDSLWIALATMITPGHPFCGKRVQESAMDADFVPLYIETNCQTIHGWDVLETCLSPGDILYLTMPANRLEQLWRVTPSQLLAS
ncbi:NAD-binding protein [Coleofasciculus sp. FACHB-64]|uniref:potassium channel family protein n=1 Tax=Cyanophyceae TaxID=3028117 RepID=UPI001684F670|nr:MULTISPECIES: NAD-binding protein [unclassified Coleofasciculus]MBD1839654.1 NAD-binding protein [Coleofasciculus sp. FACHB-501]MBD2046593.1 NAD-binding protein [Coleofasciculus sp. FACHB-64]